MTRSTHYTIFSFGSSPINKQRMRIRKNAKTCVFLETNLNLISHLHETSNLCHLNQSPWDIITFPLIHETNLLCKLNQSPWDVITFPLSSPQFDNFFSRYYVNFAANRTSADSTGPFQRVASTKNSFDCQHGIDNVTGYVDDKIKNSELSEKEVEFGIMKGDEETVKNDNIVCADQNDAKLTTNKKIRPFFVSRRSKKWVVAMTSKRNDYYHYPECEHDIDKVNENVDGKIKKCELDKDVDLQLMKGDEEIGTNEVIWTTNKVERKPFSGSRRTKKRAVVMTSKQNEYYYYSGFGPSWGKKRGELRNKGTTFNAGDTTVTNSSNVCDLTSGVDWDMGVEEEQNRVESLEVGPKQEKQKVMKKRGGKPSNIRSLKPLM